MPADLKAAFENPNCVFWFHNAWFDRLLIENTLGIILPIERYRCVMALALSHALPAGLERLGEVLGLSQDLQKVKDGKRLVLKFCKPRKSKKGDLSWSTPKTDPEDWARYKEYCVIDTASMRACAKKIPRWNYKGSELELWFLDQNVNSRGMYIDLDFVDAAVTTISENQKILAAKTVDLTDGEVQAASQRDAMMLHFMKQYGYDMPDLRKTTIESLLENDDNMPPVMRELLLIRLSTSTTSTAKYQKIANVTSLDSRVRGTIQFAGASRTLRDCLAEGSLVLVLSPDGIIHEKPIQNVEISDLVFDGEDWVAHEGVINKGVCEVISWDGVCATPDHVVYLEDGTSCSLEEAKYNQRLLWKPNLPQQNTRYTR
jgi:DNA polymerase